MNDSKKIMEKALDMLLDEAATQAEEQLLDELEEPTEEIVLSERHKKQMQKLFREERKQHLRKAWVQHSKKIACFIGILFVVSAISISSVDAWRKTFMNFFYDPDKPNMEIAFNENEWHYSNKNFSINYVPLGFEKTEEASTSATEYVRFSKDDDYFSVKINFLNGHTSIDTENATLENLTVNGYEAIISIKPEIKILLWHTDEYVFRVSGTLEKEKLLRIAESIHCWKKNPTLD